jgi:uncharacterized protein YciI
LRGYRMDEVDDVLDRLTEELRRRDEEIAELRARSASGRLPFPGPGLPADGTDGDVDAEAALWRRPANGAGAEPASPPPGVPASPPAGRHDEHGGGR